jgi:hypothetical protein
MQGVLELVAGIGVAEGGRMKTVRLMSIVCPLSSVMTCSLKCLIVTALQGITNRIAHSKKTAKLTQVKARVAAVVMTETYLKAVMAMIEYAEMTKHVIVSRMMLATVLVEEKTLVTLADAANTGKRIIMMMVTTINSKIATAITAEIAITTAMMMATTISHRTNDAHHVKTSVSVSDHPINVMTVVLTVAKTEDNVMLQTMTMTKLIALATMMIVVTVTRPRVHFVQTTGSPQYAVTSLHSVDAITTIAESTMMIMNMITATTDMIDLVLEGGAVMMLMLICTMMLDVILVQEQVSPYMHTHSYIACDENTAQHLKSHKHHNLEKYLVKSSG